MKKVLLLLVNLILTNYLFSQALGTPPTNNPSSQAQSAWYRGGNFPINANPPGANILGTRWASDIWIMTNNNSIARFTQSNALSSLTGDAGDGLRIIDLAGGAGNLDLFTSQTSGGNETHARFGNNGQISGQNNRFEFIGTTGIGNFYNVTQSSAWHNFSRLGAEQGRLGNNDFWRFGLGTNTNAARRVEIVDAAQQVRISHTNGAFAELFTRTNGRFLIMPSGANTGFTNAGDVGYNPTERIDVNGTGRFRNVATATPNALFVGVQNGGAVNDLTMKRLDFTGNPNQVLLGDGTWGTAPSGANNAANGCWLNSTSGNIEWGTNPLFHHTQIPMNQYNVLFRTSPNSAGSVIFGGTSVITALARVIVNNDHFENGMIVNSLTTNTVAIKYGIATYANNANRLTAILGNATTGNTVQGVYGVAQDGVNTTKGVRGFAISSSTQSVNMGGDFDAYGANFTENIGVRGFSNNSVKTNFGGKFKAGGTGSLSIGVYAECTPSNPATGLIGYAAYFSGGVVTTGGTLWPSDSALKHNINPLDGITDSLMQLLSPISYEYNQNGNASRLNLDSGTKFGFLAQQVAQYFPSAVKEVTHPAEFDSLGNEVAAEFHYKAVDMSQLIPVMMSDLQRKTGTIQNQTIQISSMNGMIDSLQNQVTDLNNRLTQLENCLSGILPLLCQLNQSAIQANTPAAQEEVRKNLSVTLSNRETIILDQNVPNPFAEQTVINFSIPQTVQKAQIHFYDGQGKLMQSVDVVERGLGSLTVFGADLSSGVYTYKLVADGQVVATKKMMKE